jgi:hypothetical protein
VCDGTTIDAIATGSCAVPLTALIAPPFNLTYLDSVFAKVIATNFYGDSAESLSGNGALIFLVPDPPFQLEKNPNFVSSQSAISIVWM